ncbi:HD domain-containing phosphohydrolase [Oryzomicrobium sp.]|uniref:HD domain-containing phosphohydrolase n=1 Tax=Oryzomicrobium sp. TaxID=1911578 RepID=UPI0025EE9873|nr:HD domain-containing phosphohydrolase [Oryzomicrobium sp.]MCE1241692.1 GAF domain-containing protein [Oryzomicrobium sp.]
MDASSSSAVVSPAPGKPRARRLFPLHVHLTLLFTLLIFLSGTVIGVFNYIKARETLLTAAQDVFGRIGVEAGERLERLRRPIASAVSLLSRSRLAEATTLDERMLAVPLLVETLRLNPALSAVYTGYADGAFILVRPLDNAEQRQAFSAPRDARYVVQSVERPGGQVRGRFIFLDADQTVLENRERSDYLYDPRGRLWYREALAANDDIQTAPYVFFTTQDVGQSIARRGGRPGMVVGADLTLADLSLLLTASRTTPSSELALFDADANLVAFSSPVRLVRGDLGGQLLRKSLAEVGSPVMGEVEKAFHEGRLDQPLTLSTERQDWNVLIRRIDGQGEKATYLAVAAPEDELLVDARRHLAHQGLITLLILVLTVPLTLYVSRRVSKDLRTLTAQTRDIRRFRFSETAQVQSMVREVQELSDTLGRTRRTIRRFLDISAALAAERNFGRLVQRVLKETVDAVDARAGVLYLVSDDEGCLVPEAVRRGAAAGVEAVPEGEDEAQAELLASLDAIALDGTDPRLDSVAGVARNGATSLSNLLPAAVPAGPLRAALGDAPLQLVAVPLKNRGGQVIGVLCLYREQDQEAPGQDLVSFIEQLSGAAAVAIENQRLLLGQKALLEALIKLLAGAIDAKSPYTGGHCQRVPELTKMLARAACEANAGPFADYALDDDQWEALHIAAWLHDCGKVTTPEYVVDKATKLETLYDRIHEVRMRFEVLKRDAELAYWQALARGDDEGFARRERDAELARLDADFAFVAECNEGGEFMAPERIERLRGIAARTWRRTLSDRLGISWEERQRKSRIPEPRLPVLEPLLADKPEHLIERGEADRMPADNPWGFKLDVPPYKYNRGELTNLAVGRGTLTDEERYKINDHIVQTIVMLSRLPFPAHLKRVPEIAGGHHETMDGRGYPKRLTRDEMSLEARMMAIADIFEALTAVDRPYKKGKTLSESVAIMARMARDRHVDPDLFALFLTSGVYRRYAERYLRPEQIDAVDVERALAG